MARCVWVWVGLIGSRCGSCVCARTACPKFDLCVYVCMLYFWTGMECIGMYVFMYACAYVWYGVCVGCRCGIHTCTYDIYMHASRPTLLCIYLCISPCIPTDMKQRFPVEVRSEEWRDWVYRQGGVGVIQPLLILQIKMRRLILGMSMWVCVWVWVLWICMYDVWYMINVYM